MVTDMNFSFRVEPLSANRSIASSTLLEQADMRIKPASRKTEELKEWKSSEFLPQGEVSEGLYHFCLAPLNLNWGICLTLFDLPPGETSKGARNDR
jgi:hypothetical protein